MTVDFSDPLEHGPVKEGFVGQWAFRRLVDNHRTGEQLAASGLADIFEIAPGEFRWQESGLIYAKAGAPAKIARCLNISLRDMVAGWWVTFSEGGLFHPFVSDQEFLYLCKFDLYRGTISRPREDSWTFVWKVTGPSKSFISVTTYTRVVTQSGSLDAHVFRPAGQRFESDVTYRPFEGTAGNPQLPGDLPRANETLRIWAGDGG